MKKYEPVLVKIITAKEDIVTGSQPGGGEYEGEIDGFGSSQIFNG